MKELVHPAKTVKFLSAVGMESGEYFFVWSCCCKAGARGASESFLQLGEDLFIPIKEREKTVEVGGVIL